MTTEDEGSYGPPWTALAQIASDTWHAAVDAGSSWPEAWDEAARAVLDADRRRSEASL